MKWELGRAQEITGLSMGELDVSGVPPRRLAELSRYGVDGKASLLRRHGDSRRPATLSATAVYLTTRAVDDALEVLVATRLLARAERDTAKEKLRALPKVERAGAKLAVALQVVFDTTAEQVDTDTGEVTEPKVDTLAAMWEEIEAVVTRDELAAAIAAMFELTPPLGSDSDSDADEAWRRVLVTRFSTVRPFLKQLVKVVDFGATAQGLPVVKALQSLPELMGPQEGGPGRNRHRAAGRLVEAAGAGGAALGAGRDGLEGVHVLHAGAGPPAAAAQGGVRQELLEAGRPAGQAAGRPGAGGGEAHRTGLPRPARGRGRAPGRAGRAAGRHLPGGGLPGAGERADRVRRPDAGCTSRRWSPSRSRHRCWSCGRCWSRTAATSATPLWSGVRTRCGTAGCPTSTRPT